MRQDIHSTHHLDDLGNPAGGVTTGTGIAISWQDGPLGRPVDVETQAKIDACPTPVHRPPQRYCPSCPWTENLGRKEPNGAFVEGVIEAACDRLLFYQAASGGRFACEENRLAIGCLTDALWILDARTANRELRRVEGTHIP